MASPTVPSSVLSACLIGPGGHPRLQQG